MAGTRPPQPKSPPAGTQRHAEHVPKALAGLAALTIAAYFEGVLYIRAYLAQFDASWILDEVPMAIFFERSKIPLLLIFFLAGLAIMGLFDIETKEQTLTSARFKASIVVTTYGPWTALSLGTLDMILSELGFSVAATILSILSVGMFLLLLAALFKLLLVWFRNRDIQLNQTILFLSVAVLVLSSYWAPTRLGANFGTVDKTPASSTLSSINLRGDSTDYKLLLSFGDRLYVFPTLYGGEFPRIKTASSSQVEFIQQGTTSP